MFGDNVAVVPEHDITRIRMMENHVGMVVLPRLVKGQQVIFKGGPFTGHRGIYQGQNPKDRCKVLLAYLGRVVPVLVEESLLEAA